jgi:hypothetical protein
LRLTPLPRSTAPSVGAAALTMAATVMATTVTTSKHRSHTSLFIF